MSDGDRSKRSALVAITLGFAAATLIFVSYAWMFYDMGGSRAQYAADSERNTQHNAAYAAERIENECAGIAGAALRDCIAEAVEAGAEYQQSERDLEAQRSMAKWAFWLLVIASGQLAATVVGLIYLKGTLDATWRAVKDTGDATAAMGEANRIAANVQRPWITMEAKVVDFERVSPVAFTVTWEITFANTGQMLAENFHLETKLVPMGHNFLEAMAEWFDRYEANVIERDAVLVPGQTTTSGGHYGYSIEHLPWEMKKGFRKDCVLMVLAMARYRIPGDKRWRLAMRGFSIGVNNSYIDNRHFIYDSLDDLSLERLLIQPMGRSRAT